jgi:uncharacterized membrane protein YphA (DoxX/SURF4 family)
MGDIALALRLILTLTFVSAAVGKARAPRSFQLTLEQLGMRPVSAHVAAWFVVGCEAAVALELALGADPRLIAATTGGLLFAFVATSLYAVATGRDVACNCFGAGDSRLGARTVARAALLGLAVGLYVGIAGESLPSESMLRSATVTLSFAVLALLLGRWLLTAPALAGLIAKRRRGNSMEMSEAPGGGARV